MHAYPRYGAREIDVMPLREFILFLREIPTLHNAEVGRLATAVLLGSTPGSGEQIGELLGA